jgi:hypothetical protein
MMNNNPPLDPRLCPQMECASHLLHLIRAKGGILTPMTFVGRCFRCTLTTTTYVMRPIWLLYGGQHNSCAIPHVSIGFRFSMLPGTSVQSMLPAIIMPRGRRTVMTILNSWLYIGLCYQRLLLPSVGHTFVSC